LFSRLCQCSTCIEKGVRPSLLPGEKGLELERALRGQPLTDAGLVHLKGLTSLQRLTLSGTKVTDAGLVHLKGLTSLKMLSLQKTKVTDAGVKDLQSALPKCYIGKP
jgi:Leucine-rich repeat (LRR) protein